jgi:2-aminoethylphosphonate-pyruvate transaminase
MHSPRTILLNPGPVTLSKRVRDALLRDDLCHREPDYSRLQADVRSRVSAVYDDRENIYAGRFAGA